MRFSRRRIAASIENCKRLLLEQELHVVLRQTPAFRVPEDYLRLRVQLYVVGASDPNYVVPILHASTGRSNGLAECTILLLHDISDVVDRTSNPVKVPMRPF